AGIKEGDRITKGGPDARTLRPVNNRTELATLVGSARPDVQVTLEVTPKGEKKSKKITVKLGEYKEDVPAELPKKASLEKALEKSGTPAPKEAKKDGKEDKEDKKDDTPKAKSGLFSRFNQARDRTYWVYVPSDYNPNISYGLVVWLHPVNKNKQDDFERLTDLWEDFCSEQRVIMVCPKSEHETGWVASESE